ncbi:PQQ-dependent sugar dehydrogenase [Natrinema salsiterrestre]|uniref:PQQ-dependent sugar dehydrogenase n=1 Tax=Natrinema salsiterrestre TaxID=2950540 RepID=A0A9Q4Q0U4_9EURY|nr:PQQ-dependent sugar dehydrogenase [Natrinema salsiterrestre]MDF9747015.1 PQQ-dependent sugar dehydrogenase [Natrinema salsiterrestre]
MVSPTGRRRFLSMAVAGATGLAGSSIGSAVTDPESPASIDRLPETVGLERVLGGLEAPVAVEFAADGDRRYVAERDGRLYAHESDGRRDEPFLDLRETVVTGGERGLLGLSLHPDFAENRRLFVHYSSPSRSGTPADFDHTGVLAAFEATDDGGRAKPGSERVILEIPQPKNYHNGGDIAFGPDGYCYVAIGAGGGGGGGGQDVTTDFLGGILRLDVDERAGEKAYAVPDGNPLVGRRGLDEYYAWGFRNPWRISFDDGDLFAADVGENDYEEVNLVEKGGNYGWNIKEGTHCYDADECPDETPGDVRGGEPLLDPIIEYPRENAETGVAGVSVIGGYVYDGERVPSLADAYVFGDFLASGRLFAATRPEDGNDLWPTTVVEVANGERLERLLSFGRDEEGELYVLGTGVDGGGLYRVIPAP